MNQPSNPSTLRRIVPITAWAPSYDRRQSPWRPDRRPDLGALLVPQGLAYALLAGLPPQVGLYASIMPVIVYAIFGTSRQLAVGPVAIVSLMTATTLAPLYEQGTSTYLAGAALLALLVGAVHLVLRFGRLGFVVNFLSHSVLVGFTAASAIIIVASQIKHVLGVSIPRTESFIETVRELVPAVSSTHLPTLILGTGGVAAFFPSSASPLGSRRTRRPARVDRRRDCSTSPPTASRPSARSRARCPASRPVVRGRRHRQPARCGDRHHPGRFHGVDRRRQGLCPAPPLRDRRQPGTRRPRHGQHRLGPVRRLSGDRRLLPDGRQRRGRHPHTPGVDRRRVAHRADRAVPDPGLRRPPPGGTRGHDHRRGRQPRRREGDATHRPRQANRPRRPRVSPSVRP